LQEPPDAAEFERG